MDGVGVAAVDDPCFVPQGTVLLCCPYDTCPLQELLRGHVVHPDDTIEFQVDVNVSHECSVGRWTCLSRDAMALALSIRSDECRVH